MSICRRSERRRRSGRAGFSLVEVILSTVILAVLLGVALQTMSGSTRQINHSLVLDQMRMEANQSLHKIARDLKASERGAVATRAAPSPELGDEIRLLRTSVDTSSWEQAYSAPFLYGLSAGSLVVNDMVHKSTLASYATAFTVTPKQDPLTDGNVTLSLTLERQVGVKPDGTPEVLSVTVTRTVYVRPNL